MENMELYESFRKVPDEAKKTIAAGRTKGFTDINPMWRIKKLTEKFGPCGIGWYYKPVRKWIESVGNEYAAFVDIDLYIKIDGEWSMPITGTGGSKLATVEKSGLYVSDECYKMATTDAISVACKQLGIGADVYFSQDKTKYDIPEDDNRKINEHEQKLLELAAKRTGMNLIKAIEDRHGKSIQDVTLSVYTAWMIKLATVDSEVPKAPADEIPDIPEDIDEQTPFK